MCNVLCWLITFVIITIFGFPSNQELMQSQKLYLNNYDLIVVLGGQIIKINESIIPAFHTESRVIAAGILNYYSNNNSNTKFIMSGGYNVGVRYDLKENKIFNNANFSFESFIEAKKNGPSEAEVMKQFLLKNFNIEQHKIFVEDLSATTIENAKLIKLLLSRENFFFPNVKKIGLLTNLYHMSKAAEEFTKANITFDLLFAEDFISLNHPITTKRDWCKEMETFYSISRGGKNWNSTAIAEIMRERKTGNITRTVYELYK